ncbi:MAG: hypothetical protein PUB52_10290 [Lachnospiraceae bacterium]|nr:hypothetical protein [Lachnospiraceae bacterium]
MTAVWCLLMPPYLYGVLGVPVTMVLAYVIGRQLPDIKATISTKFKWYYILPLALIFYMFGMEFYDKWRLSGKLLFFANLFGMSVEAFLLLVIVLGSIAGSLAVLYLICIVMRTESSKEFPEENIPVSNRKLLPMDIAFAVVVTLCLGMRLALNPWSDVLTGNDSAAYIYVAMMMKKGSVLYVDIFEHKGIFLYLTDLIGLLLTEGKLTGIWILELVNAFITALLTFKVTKLLTTKRPVQYITVAASVAALTVCMLLTDGNLSEEWVLPWITLGLYICLKYLIDKTYRFYEIILLGVGCAYIIFMRANMIAVFAAFMPIILVQMIIKKDWRNIGICVVNFILGLAIVTVPVIVYSVMSNSFEGMLDCYFLFSLSYCEKSAMPIWKVIWLLFRRQTIYSVLLLAATKLFYKNHLYQMNLWFYILSLGVASMSGRAHAHYSIILIPALILPMVVLLSRIKGIHMKKPLAMMMALGIALWGAQFAVSVITYQDIPLSPVAQYLQDYTEKDDNVLMMGNNCIYYLEGDRYTTNRYYYQTPAVNVRDDLCEDFIEELQETKPEAIFAIGDREQLLAEDENITKAYLLLDEWGEMGEYTREEYDAFTVYRRND